MAEHNDIGKIGEEKAVEFLIKNDYFILKTNYRYLKAEIDIIAENTENIIFIEVKTRTDDAMQNPVDAVDIKKKKLILSAANFYLEENNVDKNARFDIISIIKKNASWEINHLPDAFNSVY